MPQPLKSAGLVDWWTDRDIRGEVQHWDSRIGGTQPDVVIFLVSATFLASDYVCKTEITMAMEREKSGKATVIPIILEDTHGT
ncbi:MAG: toll/interleukin-1 receptor domain-containing protein [Verrucomicrobiales bacterium]